MGIYLTLRKNVYYLLEKEDGRVIEKFSLKTSDKKEAEEKRIKYIRDKSEFIKNKSKVLLSQLRDEYIAMNQPPIKTIKTIKTLRTAFSQFEKIVGNKYLYEYSNKDIDLFLSKKINEASVHTAHGIRRALRPAFKQAIRWAYIDKNPWDNSMRIKLPEPEPSFLTKDQYEKLLSECIEVVRDFIIWDTHTGMRAEELMKLRPEHVLIKKKIIKVYSTVENPNKDKESRDIEMHKSLIPIYEKYKHQEHLFINPKTGRRFSETYMLKYVTAACKRAGIPHFCIKDFRSTYGMWLINKGAPLKWISQQMGHSSIAITERHYAKYITNEYTGMIDKLDF